MVKGTRFIVQSFERVGGDKKCFHYVKLQLRTRVVCVGLKVQRWKVILMG